MPHSARAGLATRLHVTGEGVVAGYVADTTDLSRRFVVDLIVDGLPVAVLRACAFWSGAPSLALGDGCYAFYWPMPEGLLQRADWIEARLANTDLLIGRLDRGEDGLPTVPSNPPQGVAHWQGGLAIRGWVPKPETAVPPRVTAWIGGQLAADTVCREWLSVSLEGRTHAVPAFTLRLPDVLADGRARSVDIIGPDGLPLLGSPLSIVAFRDRLADLVEQDATLKSERVRARFADGLLPQSVPFSALSSWLDRQAEVSPGPIPSPQRAGIILVGDGDERITQASLTDDAAPTNQLLPLPGVATAFWTDDLERCVTGAGNDCDLFVFTLKGVRLRPGAAAHLRQALTDHPDSNAAYADVTISDADGQAWPLAWPAFDRERWQEQGYAAYFFAVRAASVARAIGAGARSLFEVFEAQLGRPGTADQPVHVPLLLAHLPKLPVETLLSDLCEIAKRRPGLSYAPKPVEGGILPSIRTYRRSAPTSITAIVPCRSHAGDLRNTLESLAALQRSVDMNVVLVGNDSADPATLQILTEAAKRGCQVVTEPGWYKPPHLLNRGAAIAASDLLLFVTPGITLPDPASLHELVERVQQADVGAVSPLVVGERGTIEHAGYIVGPMPGIVMPFRDRNADDPGYAAVLRGAHERSAVAAACLLTKRLEFQSTGGFDAVNFPLHVYDVDLCLKLRAGGHRIIVTPHARVSGAVECLAVTGLDARVPTRDHELSRLRHRWDLQTACDPFYSPWLNTDGDPYSGLNWFPKRMSSRRMSQPPARSVAEGF